MASKVDICNLALVSIGVSAISAITGDSQGAIVCNAVYDQLIDELLRQVEPNFAQTRAALALESAAPAFGYDYSYTLPQNCLKVISLEDPSDPFTVESGSLLTDTEDAKIRYIKEVSDSSQFDSSFVVLAGARIAAEIAFKLAVKPQLQQQAMNKYLRLLSSTTTIDASEGVTEPTQNTTMEDFRS
jgi:hypothetical protein